MGADPHDLLEGVPRLRQHARSRTSSSSSSWPTSGASTSSASLTGRRFHRDPDEGGEPRGVLPRSCRSRSCILVPALAMKLWPDELKLGHDRAPDVLPGQAVAGRRRQVPVGLAPDRHHARRDAGHADDRADVMRWPTNGLDWGPVWGSYAAALLLGAAFLSVGLFAGALCREQVTAFIVSLFICGGLVAVGQAGSDAPGRRLRRRGASG